MMILFQRKILPNSWSSRKLWSAVHISVIRSAQIQHTWIWLMTFAKKNCIQKGTKIPFSSKAVLVSTFLLYITSNRKNKMAMPNFAIYSQSAIFALWSCTLNAAKRPETALCTEFCRNRDKTLTCGWNSPLVAVVAVSIFDYGTQPFKGVGLFF